MGQELWKFQPLRPGHWLIDEDIGFRLYVPTEHMVWSCGHDSKNRWWKKWSSDGEDTSFDVSIRALNTLKIEHEMQRWLEGIKCENGHVLSVHQGFYRGWAILDVESIFPQQPDEPTLFGRMRCVATSVGLFELSAKSLETPSIHGQKMPTKTWFSYHADTLQLETEHVQELQPSAIIEAREAIEILTKQLYKPIQLGDTLQSQISFARINQPSQYIFEASQALVNSTEIEDRRVAYRLLQLMPEDAIYSYRAVQCLKDILRKSTSCLEAYDAMQAMAAHAGLQSEVWEYLQGLLEHPFPAIRQAALTVLEENGAF